MLVLRTSNFQGATIRPIRLQLNYFQDFETKAVKAKYKIGKRKEIKTINTISVVYFLRNTLVYRKIFTDDYYPSGYFRLTGTMG